MKIGLMGGTFDPIHIGHLILAESAYTQLQLDTVLFMLAGNPNLKQNREGRASNTERYEMTKLAISSNPHFQLSDYEMKKTEFSYTAVTLEELKKTHPGDTIYFITGADSLFTIDQWYHPERVLSQCIFVVATRDTTDDLLDRKIQEVEQRYGGTIQKLRTGNIEISSTMLREKIMKQESVRYFMPDEVIEYIQSRGIYQNPLQ